MEYKGQAGRDSIEGVFTLGYEGQIVAPTPSAAEMFGCSAEQIVGLEFERMLAPPHRHGWRERFEELAGRGGTGRPPGADVDRREVFAQRCDDGGVFPVVVATSALAGSAARQFVAVVHDRTRERQLERRLQNAQERERRRIGRELHDSVGGQLTGIEIAAALLQRRLSADGSPHADEVGDVVEQLARLHERVRDVSRGLLPVADDPLGLMSALQRLAKLNHGKGGTRCHFRSDGEVTVTDVGVATNVYHIAEEALLNALRHADATQVTIALERPAGDQTLLIVVDDGIGIPDEPGTGDGIGLDSMAQRALLIGAELEVSRAEPAGTIVRCAVGVGEAGDNGERGS